MATPFIGEIRLFGFPRIPVGWFACDGSLQSIAEYETLYALIGTTFGGDGVNTFGLPDLRGRVPISHGSGRGLTTRPLGELGGEPQHTLLITEIPSHSHPLTSTTNVGTTVAPSNTVHLGTVSPNTAKLYAPASNVTNYLVMAPSINPAGAGLPHQNMMPTLTGNFCISWVGVYPLEG